MINSFVAYDFETSGLSSTSDCIIEIGAIKVINGIIDESEKFKFQCLLKPNNGVKQISPFIERLTGISNDMLIDGLELQEAINNFIDFIEDYPLVGYNSKTFDCNFLYHACSITHNFINNEQIDLIKQARIYKNSHYLKDAKLTTMAKHFNIINKNAHRAYDDALTTAKLYLKLNSCDNNHIVHF